MQPHSIGSGERPCAGGRNCLRTALLAALVPALAACRMSAAPVGPTSDQNPAPQPALPDAPQPQPPAKQKPKPVPPCKPSQPVAPGQAPAAQPCRTRPRIDWFARFLTGPAVKPLSPAEKARLAARNFLDPFNAVTILGTSAISVAADSHSAYGPGMTGFGRYVGVSYAEDLTGEFFGTFLIPSIDHEYPHYVRMPNASLKRRIAHCIYQPFWTISDTGQGMPNYSNLVGTIADEAVDVAYVPYQQVGWGASAERISTAWATAPIGNFITEFVPDLARHVNFNVVFVQRIIDRVAVEEGGGLSTTPTP